MEPGPRNPVPPAGALPTNPAPDRSARPQPKTDKKDDAPAKALPPPEAGEKRYACIEIGGTVMRRSKHHANT